MYCMMFIYWFMDSMNLSFSDLPLYFVCLWTCTYVVPMPSSVRVCVGVQVYLTELQALLRSVSETDFKLNSPEYWPAAYYNLPQQEHCLKVSTAVVFLSECHRWFFSGNNIMNSQAGANTQRDLYVFFN